MNRNNFDLFAGAVHALTQLKLFSMSSRNGSLFVVCFCSGIIDCLLLLLLLQLDWVTTMSRLFGLCHFFYINRRKLFCPVTLQTSFPMIFFILHFSCWAPSSGTEGIIFYSFVYDSTRKTIP